jgi:DNA invertase Pin-like site-specific DNA recombinase
MTVPTRACAYYRFSDDRQENSIARQRSQVEPYAAKNGYVIVKEYEDLGIPGDEEKRRKGFNQMMADAQRGQFAVILCDDRDRWMRADSITSGHYVYLLRSAGVRLETVAQGRIDWNSFASRIIDSVLAEAKKLESQATSRRVISRMLLMAKQGKWLGGPVPYGYRLVADPVLGKKLVPGDPAQVRVVQLIFRLYGDKGFSLDMISAELHARAVLNPKGGEHWHKSTLRKILGSRKYVGDQTWNVGHAGKYSEVVGGDIHTSDSRLASRLQNAREDWIVVPDLHEPLVERDLFERIQTRLQQNQLNTSPARKDRPYLLSGLLVCGACGYRMIGTTQRGQRYYVCGRYHSAGNRACACNLIAGKRLVRCLLQRIEAVLLNPAHVAQLRAEVQQKAQHFEQARPVLAPTSKRSWRRSRRRLTPPSNAWRSSRPTSCPSTGQWSGGSRKNANGWSWNWIRPATPSPTPGPTSTPRCRR